MAELNPDGTMWGESPAYWPGTTAYYVSPTAQYRWNGVTREASNENDGLSPERAFQTPSPIEAVMKDGDTVVLLPGTHTFSPDNFTNFLEILHDNVRVTGVGGSGIWHHTIVSLVPLAESVSGAAGFLVGPVPGTPPRIGTIIENMTVLMDRDSVAFLLSGDNEITIRNVVVDMTRFSDAFDSTSAVIESTLGLTLLDGSLIEDMLVISDKAGIVDLFSFGTDSRVVFSRVTVIQSDESLTVVFQQSTQKSQITIDDCLFWVAVGGTIIALGLAFGQIPDDHSWRVERNFVSADLVVTFGFFLGNKVDINLNFRTEVDGAAGGRLITVIPG